MDPLQVAVSTHVEVELISESGEVEHLACDIVPDAEADFAGGYLGAGTPLARAILGHTAGSAVPYRVGDTVIVRILSVSAALGAPPSDAAARQQAVIRKAIDRSEVLNDMAFALAAGSKWGDYNPKDIAPEPRPNSATMPLWAPRVPQYLIRRLYETDAQGIYDQDLIDQVGIALYMRCESFIIAVEAAKGRVRCPDCRQVVLHHAAPDETLHCARCGWKMAWQAYSRSMQHKQLSGAEPVIALFQAFVSDFPTADSPREKMLLIDRLIHGFHRRASRAILPALQV
jgi:hypothetical protein